MSKFTILIFCSFNIILSCSYSQVRFGNNNCQSDIIMAKNFDISDIEESDSNNYLKIHGSRLSFDIIDDSVNLDNCDFQNDLYLKIVCETDNDCDDDNPCTKESCFEGFCLYDQMSPADCFHCESANDCDGKWHCSANNLLGIATGYCMNGSCEVEFWMCAGGCAVGECY